MPKGKSVLTTGEVARICQVAPRTVSKWFDSGQLKGYRIPGSRDRRIPVHALCRFMREHDMPLDALGTNTVRVLIVDAATTTEGWTADLGEGGSVYDVRRASEPLEAGLVLARFTPHVVLVNTVSVAVDPPAWVRVIRGDEDIQAARLVALIPGGSPTDLASWREHGFDASLSQCDPASLCQCIEEMTAILY